MIAKCSCQHCSKFIEFESKDLVEENSVVPCPYCGLETKLHFDEDFSAESSSAFIDDKSKSLQERIAIFKTHTEANKLKRDAELKQLGNIIQRYETTAKIQSIKDELELAVDKIPSETRLGKRTGF
jgi:hypothetical protein